ncbi:MAG: fibrobacter succinogenes major paralogous domain-containing protein [Bacteroidota bacterium]
MKKVIVFLSFLFFTINGKTQNVGIGTTTPALSAQLDVSSTTKGFLPPRLTSLQRDSIQNPAAGLVIFNTTLNSIQLNNGSQWVSLVTPSTTAVFLPTIVIGTQQWMAKNLDVAFYKNGDPIPHVSDPIAWNELSTGAWCYYNNDSTLGNTYGKLYNWYAVNDPRGLAPAGWHIPNDGEWTTLKNNLGDSIVAGGQLKEAGPTHWNALFSSGRGNNNSGFTALPGGYRNFDGTFSQIGNWGDWWSATQDDIFLAGYNHIHNFSSEIKRYSHYKFAGFSVRCIRD